MGIGGGLRCEAGVHGFRGQAFTTALQFDPVRRSETGLTTVCVNEVMCRARHSRGLAAHETSQNLSAGLVLTLDEFDFSIDAYSTNVEDRVVRSGGLDCAGFPACDAIRVGTAAFFFNGVDTETRGADLSVRWGSPLGSGHLLLSANANVNETSIVERKTPAGAPGQLGFSDYFGGWTADLLENGQPQRQANFTADWDHDRYGGLVRLNHYGATTQHPLDTGMIWIDAATVVDVEARFQAGTVRGALGINNLADKLPTELAKTHLANILWVSAPTETPFVVRRFAYLRLPGMSHANESPKKLRAAILPTGCYNEALQNVAQMQRAATITGGTSMALQCQDGAQVRALSFYAKWIG